ncbi:MAG: N-acetylneuraminate synthase family protein [Alphaproteobacteria bacterium]
MKNWLQHPEAGACCAIVGEVAQAHDGSLGLAHAFVDAIAAAGATAVKFQTHIAAAESTPAEPWRRRFSPQDERRYDYWRRMEFSAEQWNGLKVHAESKGLVFLSSPFSLEAFELLRRLGVGTWKVASGEIARSPLLNAIAATGQPVMLSTGMSEITEIDAAVDLLRGGDCPLAVMQCSSMYPCPPESVGLNMLDVFRARYDCATGLSDHSGTTFPALAAATKGAEVLEVHVTLSRQMFGPDVAASVTSAELGVIVEGIRFIERMNSHPVDKTDLPGHLATLRQIFMKSIVARRDLRRGTVLAERHLTIKKPAGGMTPQQLPEVLGRRLQRDVRQDQQINLEDLE